MLTIITPTFNARDRLHSAISSVLDQTSSNWELIICPDDANDYAELVKIDARIKVIPSNMAASGPAAARNRGLEHAKGLAIAYLDDDDQLSKSYVEDSLNALQSREAIIFPTIYSDDADNVARIIGQDLRKMTIKQFALELGSLHVVAQRQYFPNWNNFFAEDVIHTCETIDRIGGEIDIIHSASYLARIRSGSMCSSSKDIDARYRLIINEEFKGISKSGQADLKSLFKFRQYMNTLFAENASEEDYNFFVQNIDKLKRLDIFNHSIRI